MKTMEDFATFLREQALEHDKAAAESADKAKRLRDAADALEGKAVEQPAPAPPWPTMPWPPPYPPVVITHGQFCACRLCCPPSFTATGTTVTLDKLAALLNPETTCAFGYTEPTGFIAGGDGRQPASAIKFR